MTLLRPKARVTPAVSTRPCIQIRVTWGASTIDVAHLDVPRSFTLAELLHACEPGALVVPPGAPPHQDMQGTLLELDAAGWPCVLLRDDAPVETSPRGVEQRRLAGEVIELPSGRSGLRLIEGDRATIAVAGVEVVLVALDPAPAPRLARTGFDRRTKAVAVGVLLAHAGLFAVLSTQEEAPLEGGPSGEQIAEMQRLLRVAAENDEERASERGVDTREGGTGTRAKGDEGSLGAGPARATGSRFGVRGPQEDPHVARQRSLREAQEFGMIGLLDSGAGGDPSAPPAPWGRDAQGSGPGIGLGSIGTVGHGAGSSTGKGSGASPGGVAPSARGNLWGDSIGESRGGGGLGLSGLGQGGGGAAAPRPLGGGAPGSPAATLPGAPVDVPIDPNGRFATTYRPGAGHLASFEAALARGVLPPTAREVVADVGAGADVDLAAPTESAIAWRADFERGRLAPGGGPTHLRIALRSSAKSAGRPRLSMHLVFDVSGSMEGEAMVRAQQAARELVERLAPTDHFSLVTFSSDAQVRVPDGLVGPRRAAIQAVIEGLRTDGGTNISEGLRLGYAEAHSPHIPEDAQKVVFLLSDGRPNGGMTNREHLARAALDAFQDGIQTSAFGLGADYDGALMSQIASEGAGGYYYVANPEHIGAALATELGKRLDPVALGVEVRVRLKDDVKLLGVYGSRRLGAPEAEKVRAQEIGVDVVAAKKTGIARDRQDDAEGGMRFFMPAFGRDDAHSILLKVDLPPGVGERGVATLEIKYKDLLRKKNAVEERPLRVTFADSDAASAATADRSMQRIVQRFGAGQALAAASLRVQSGDARGALAMLDERVGILDHAAVALGDVTLVAEAGRLRRLRTFLDPSGQPSDPLALAMLVETAGQSRLR